MEEEQLEEIRAEIDSYIKKAQVGFNSSLEDISKRLNSTDMNKFPFSAIAKANIKRLFTTRDAYIITVFGKDQDVFTVDGRGFVSIAEKTDGKSLVRVYARHLVGGSGAGTTTVMIRNQTDSADILSTAITIDSTETGSDTAATPAVINTANSVVSTNDLIYANITAIPANAPQGLQIVLEFE